MRDVIQPTRGIVRPDWANWNPPLARCCGQNLLVFFINSLYETMAHWIKMRLMPFWFVIALSGDHHGGGLSCHGRIPKPGWWDSLLPRKKAIDYHTSFLCVALNNLGGLWWALRPKPPLIPETGQRWEGKLSPLSPLEDWVQSQARA